MCECRINMRSTPAVVGASSGGSTPTGRMRESPQPTADTTVPSVSLQPDYLYILTTDDDLNDALREEFYYDQVNHLNVWI